MMKWSKIVVALLLVSTSIWAQEQPQNQANFDAASVQDTLNEPYKNIIYYPEQLKHFFTSLKELSEGKRKK
ncbi:hypothetical protein QNH98_04015 [Myroides sp. mNGS23_01]|nr:hypothetical protein [Myroides sp. mNGS23_01]WHT39850.1 hypothetical protein QNH98_04015 [Myroides sp. mNGS23_01]